MQDMDDRRHKAWLRVALLYSRVFRVMNDRLSSLGLSVAQFDLLACLVAAEPKALKQSELASRLLVTKGNVSGMLTRMTEQGTVRRQEDASDKRSKRILITDQGRELYSRGRAIQDSLVSEIFGHLPLKSLSFLEEVTEELCEKISSETSR